MLFLNWPRSDLVLTVTVLVTPVLEEVTLLLGFIIYLTLWQFALDRIKLNMIMRLINNTNIS